MATKLKQKRSLVKTLSQMGITTAKNLGGIANTESRSNVDLLISIPNGVTSILSNADKTSAITGLLNIDQFTATATGNVIPNFFGTFNKLGSISVLTSGNNYSALSNVVIENQSSTGAVANLVIHYKLKEIYGNFGLGNNYGRANVTVSGGTLVSGGRHANITPIIVANLVAGFTILDNGNGYLQAPNIIVNRLDGNVGQNAVFDANLGYGYIDRIILVNAGTGGYSSSPNITINANNSVGANANIVVGSNATAIALLESSDTNIKTISMPTYANQANANTAFTSVNNHIPGAMFFDTSTNKLMVYNGTVWISIN